MDHHTVTSDRWHHINAYLDRSEHVIVTELNERLQSVDVDWPAISQQAQALTHQLRAHDEASGAVLAMIRHYNLSTQEGIILMSLAESLLRIPDQETKRLLLSEKLTDGAWCARLAEASHSAVSMAARGLSLSSAILKENSEQNYIAVWRRLLRRLGEPVIKKAVTQAIALMGEHFVLGADIHSALHRAKSHLQQKTSVSFDMLGEAALTADDAAFYYQRYESALYALGELVQKEPALRPLLGISVKLSALHPRYELTQCERAVAEISKKLLALAQLAKQFDLALTVDAEEAERLTMSLAIFENVYKHAALAGEWCRFGLAVQAYQTRALSVLRCIDELAHQGERQIEVRLVKGAYWDSEIKWAQMQGHPRYPVFTAQSHTVVRKAINANSLSLLSVLLAY